MSKDPKPVTPQDVECRDDIVYGTGGGRELQADLYLPSEPAAARIPAVVYAHGGGWRGGDRTQFSRHAIAMARHDFAGLCISYRFADEAPFPAAVEDANCAVRFLRAYADDLGVDPDRIGIAGGSAGGHLAAMVSTTCGTARLEGTGGHGDFSSDVQAYAGFNPVLDLRGQRGPDGGGGSSWAVRRTRSARRYTRTPRPSATWTRTRRPRCCCTGRRTRPCPTSRACSFRDAVGRPAGRRTCSRPRARGTGSSTGTRGSSRRWRA